MTRLFDIKANGTYIELTRLWCMQNAPMNTESRIIGQSLKLLPKEINLVVSFSDTEQGHIGIIYQASNFYYLGRNDGGTMLKPKMGGVLKHPRLIGIYRQRHKEYADKSSEELLQILGYEMIKVGGKHRYVYLRGTKAEKQVLYARIRDRIQPYPKGFVKRIVYEDDLLPHIEKQQLTLW